MSTSSKYFDVLPPEQQAIMAKCFHPSGSFTEFSRQEVEQSFPDRFEKIARMYPDGTAIKTADRVLSYADLNAIANGIAQAIIAQHGHKSELIGLLLETGVALIASMLAVLKAGKYFVLLDPSFPKPRIGSLLEDSQAEILLTDSEHFSLASEVAGSTCRLINLKSITGGNSAENICLPISADALAYFTYTSGSTGRPKCVLQTHRMILHDAMLRINGYHLCDRDRFGLLASGTSSAIRNALVVHLGGAALLPYQARNEGITGLIPWLSEEKISICLIASPLFRSLCETLSGQQLLADLRLLRLTSETLYSTDVCLFKNFFPSSCVLFNGLSSTETGLLRLFPVDHNTEIAGSEVPVGFAVEDQEILLLDDDGKDVGFNAVGEMVVRSKYLSPGYWKDPALTQAKFKADPDGGEKRLYFTGDLGLMLPEGRLVHKGRKDFRVKIRGYGVDLKEVGKALLDHSAITGAVLVARRNKLGESFLVAYVSSPSERKLTVGELMNFLKHRLPDYVIPSRFVFLDAFPLTPNGKIDRKALPDPGRSRPELDTPLLAGRTPLEKDLAQIWGEVLELDQIGIHDNFLDLGGDSLAATRIVSRVIARFQTEIPLRSLFQSPTVAEMAVVIKEHEAKKLEQNDLDRILTELEALSEEDAQRVLSTIMQNEAS